MQVNPYGPLLGLIPHKIEEKTYPIGDLTRHGSNHPNASWDVLLLEDASAMFSGNECSDHAEESVSIVRPGAQR